MKGLQLASLPRSSDTWKMARVHTVGCSNLTVFVSTLNRWIKWSIDYGYTHITMVRREWIILWMPSKYCCVADMVIHKSRTCDVCSAPTGLLFLVSETWKIIITSVLLYFAFDPLNMTCTAYARFVPVRQWSCVGMVYRWYNFDSMLRLLIALARDVHDAEVLLAADTSKLLLAAYPDTTRCVRVTFIFPCSLAPGALDFLFVYEISTEFYTSVYFRHELCKCCIFSCWFLYLQEC